MFILGIETSCDETAAGVLEIRKTRAGFFIHPLSNVISSQIKIHRKYGGVVPMLASREHTKNISIVAKKALKRAFQSESEKEVVSKIDLIAVTKGPGLILSLLIGLNFAKTLAWKWNKPIIGVNHLEGHLLSFLLPQKTENYPAFATSSAKASEVKKATAGKQLPLINYQKFFPAVCLLVSGGHTQLIHIKDFRKYKIIGETRDDAAGECFDKGARILGLGYPGGPAIAAEAVMHKKQETRNKKQNTAYPIHNTGHRFQLPRPMIDSNDYDFSFSGLKTALLYLVQDLGTKKAKKHSPAIAYEFQEAITDVLVKKTIKAAKELKTRSIILAGGVSANKRLKEKFQKKLTEEKIKIKLFAPQLEYTTDNAIMIALAGFFQYIEKDDKKSWNWKKIEADANLRLR